MAQNKDVMLVSDVLSLYTNRDNINNDNLVNEKFQDAPSGSNNLYYYGGGALAIGAAAVAIGGGSGGGGGASSPSFTSDIYDITGLTQTISESFFFTDEFNNYPLDALRKSNAQYAYARNLSGAGVLVAVWDDFQPIEDLTDEDYYLSIPEEIRDNVVAFSPASSGSYTDKIGDYCHGEEVAIRLAGLRSKNNYQGMAYKSYLTLYQFEAPIVGFGTRFKSLIDTNFTVDPGTGDTRKVKVVNTSCGDCLSLADLQYAKDNDVLVTASTGNTGGPDPENPAGYAPLLDYSLIAVSAVEANGQMTYAERCGTARNYCMVA